MTPNEPAALTQLRAQVKEGIQEGLIEPMQNFYPGNAKINRDQVNDISAVLAETLVQLDRSGKHLTSGNLAAMLRDDQDMHEIFVGFIDTIKSLERDEYNLLMDLFKGEISYEE